MSNPKVALFFLAFFPQFVHHNAGPITAQLLVLGIVFCLIGLLSDSLYALASGAIRQRAGGNRRLLGRTERASAVLYLGLAAGPSGPAATSKRPDRPVQPTGLGRIERCDGHEVAAPAHRSRRG